MTDTYKNIHSWVDPVNGDRTPYLQLPCDFLKEKAFLDLPYAARIFYIVLCAHKESAEQQACLEGTLTKYNEIFGLGMNEHDIQCEARPYKKTSKYTNGNMFVIPESQLEKYGFNSQYANTNKKILEDRGFIEVVYAKKGKYDGWSKNVTVYKFSNKWKSKST